MKFESSPSIMTSIKLLKSLILGGRLASANAQDKVGLSVRFAAQYRPPEMPPVVMTLGETVTAPFEISTEWLSDPMAAPGRSFALTAEGAEKEFVKVKLPESGSSFVILLVAGKDRTAIPLVIPDNRTTLKGWDAYAYNSTEATLLGLLGRKNSASSPVRPRW